MTTKVSLAALGAAAVACALGVAGPAAAQQASTARFGSYFETMASRACEGTINCILGFDIVPRKSDILLENVTCRISSSHIPAGLVLRTPGKGGSGFVREVNLPIRDYTYVKRISADDYSYSLSFTAPIKLYVEAETRPVIEYRASAVSGPQWQSINCALVGTAMK